jgi:PAS domain S-box-containing protein
MIDSGLLFVSLSAYLIFLLAIAWWGARSDEHSRFLSLTRSRWVYTLSLSVYCTSWTFFGIVGSASLGGGIYLSIFWGAILAFFFSSILLRRMIAVKNLYRVTSIADFLSARYFRSQKIAALVTIMALVGVTPYIALQLKAINNSFSLISAEGDALLQSFNNWVPALSALFMVLFTIVFGLRHLDTTERHPGVTLAMAVESLVKLLAFMCAGLLVVYVLFDGFEDVFSQAEQLRQTDERFAGYLSTPTFVKWVCYLLVSASGIFFLPRQFHLAVVENSDPKHVRTAQWGLPLYLFLILLFVIPISLGGLVMGYSPEEADTFVLLLPMQTDSPWLSLFVFIGGFSASMGMIIISAMSMSVILSNHILLPLLEVIPGLKWLRRHLLKLRWFAVAFFIYISYQFNAHVGDSYMLASMGILSFVAVLQFAPAALGGLFWSKASRLGALAGLLSGFIIWCYTLLLPSLIKSDWLPLDWLERGPWGNQWLHPEALLGLSGLDTVSHGVIWTLIFNITAFLFISLLFPGNREEREYNREFQEVLSNEVAEKPTFELPHSIFLPNKVIQAREVLEEYLSHEESVELLNKILDELGLKDQSYVTLMDLNLLQKELGHRLSGSIGAASAHRAISRAAFVNPAERESIRNIYSDLLNELNISPHELQAKVSYYQEREKLIVSHSEQQAETIRLLQEQMHQREQAELDKGEIENRLQSILDYAPSVIYLKDLQGRYVLVNQQFLKIFNLEMEQVVGLDDFAIFSPEAAKVFQKNDQEVIALGKFQESEEVAEHADGTHTYISMKFPIFNNKKEIIASGGISTDISDRKASEEQLLRFNQELESKVTERTQSLQESNNTLQQTLRNLETTQGQLIESEKMASLGSLVAGIAHEINTPVGIGVTAVSSMQQETESITKKMAHDELTRGDLDAYLDIVNESNGLVLNNLERAAELVRTFKLVAVDQSAEDLRSFMLYEYVQDVMASLRPALNKAHVKVDIHCPSEILMHSYPGALSQVLTNLVMNALKHGFSELEKNNQAVDSSHKDQQHQINLSISLAEDHMINIVFSDNGKGVSPEVLPRIFDPFITTARGQGSSGLGAHIVYNLVTQKLHGHIEASSELGKGLTMNMHWPRDIRETIDPSI